MKRFLLLLCALFALSLPAHAAPPPLAAMDGFATVVDGERYDGVPAEPGDASYAIESGGETLLTVQARVLPAPDDAAGDTEQHNAFYAVRFTADYLGQPHECFVTGLSAGNVQKLQDGLIEAFQAGKPYRINDADFIDAEKVTPPSQTPGEHTDARLCWAAASANLLRYTGWAARADYASEDAVMNLFAACFTDEAGHPAEALRWFFNGYYDRLGQENWSQPTGAGEYAYGVFPGKLPAYAAEACVSSYDLRARPQDIELAAAALRDGGGVALSVDYFRDGENTGGHALTLWGYVRRSGSFAKENYAALILSDSDNAPASVDGYVDRALAYNDLHLIPMTASTSYDADSWLLQYATDGVDTRLTGCTVLLPAEGAEADTGGRDRVTALPDLIVESVSVSDTASEPGGLWACRDVFAAQTPLYVRVTVKNASRIACAASVPCALSFGSAGSTALCGPLAAGASEELSFTLPARAEGSYTLNVSLNGESSRVPEAYYGNNSHATAVRLVSAAPAASWTPLWQEGGSVAPNLSGGARAWRFFAVSKNGAVEPQGTWVGSPPAALYPKDAAATLYAVVFPTDYTAPATLLSAAPAVKLRPVFAAGDAAKEFTSGGLDHLAGSDAIRFEVRDESTVAGSHGYTAYVQAVPRGGGSAVELFSQTGSLTVGAASDAFSFRDWTARLTPYAAYDLWAYVQSGSDLTALSLGALTVGFRGVFPGGPAWSYDGGTLSLVMPPNVTLCAALYDAQGRMLDLVALSGSGQKTAAFRNTAQAATLRLFRLDAAFSPTSPVVTEPLLNK